MSKEPISIQEARKVGEEAKDGLIRKIEQDARSNEVEYFGCCQVVLDALQRNLNIGNGGAFKAASALLGGVAMTREVCGALVGGVMAIGLVYGRASLETGKVGHENLKFLEARVRGSRLCDRFKETTLSKKEVMDRLKEDFIPLYMSRDQHKIPNRFEVKGVPRHYFLRSDGKLIHADQGSREPDGFYSILDEVDLKKD